MANWKQLIDKCADGDEIIRCTLTDDELAKEFDDGYGWPEGEHFTAWSHAYVYFPVCYDGAESVGRAPRHFCNEACSHVGGW